MLSVKPYNAAEVGSARELHVFNGRKHVVDLNVMGSVSSTGRISL